jgi:murein DD-endopeptidase MepM/ murein hydrolase activator NlpD
MRVLSAALVGALAVAIAPILADDVALQIRFYPEKVLRAYELDARHGWSGVLLQNVAVVNASDVVVTIDGMEMELWQGSDVVQTHRVSAGDLERAAKRGAGLQKAGLLDRLAFQFRPEVLLGQEKTLSPERRLAPRSALLVGHRFLAFTGAPDQLRVRALGRSDDGRSFTAESKLPIVLWTSTVEYDFPLAGRWYVGAGQGLHSHHRWAVPEEFALDIVRLGETGSTHRGDGSKRTDYYAYGADVLAAADGAVVTVVDAMPETDANMRKPGETAAAYEQRVLAEQAEILQRGVSQAMGNYVVLAHAGGEFSSYAHLQPGSVRAKKGDAVKRGSIIGRLGHSGNSTEPHLHFQVTDGPDPLLSAGVPVRFRNLTIPFADGERAVQSGDLVETLKP